MEPSIWFQSISKSTSALFYGTILTDNLPSEINASHCKVKLDKQVSIISQLHDRNLALRTHDNHLEYYKLVEDKVCIFSYLHSKKIPGYESRSEVGWLE